MKLSEGETLKIEIAAIEMSQFDENRQPLLPGDAVDEEVSHHRRLPRACGAGQQDERPLRNNLRPRGGEPSFATREAQRHVVVIDVRRFSLLQEGRRVRQPPRRADARNCSQLVR